MTILDKKYPGIKNALDYTELGTSLTYDHFCNSHRGIPYGLSSTPERFKTHLSRPTTPLKNLFLCGQDMVMPGVPAAVGSANLCCALILRKNIGGYWTKKGRRMNGSC
jgi:all-trans-retinol 13,14-reductase